MAPRLTPPPGWYPDPRAGGGERWWDGRQWSPRTRRSTGGRPAGGDLVSGAGRLVGLAAALVLLGALWTPVARVREGVFVTGLSAFDLGRGWLVVPAVLAVLATGLTCLAGRAAPLAAGAGWAAAGCGVAAAAGAAGMLWELRDGFIELGGFGAAGEFSVGALLVPVAAITLAVVPAAPWVRAAGERALTRPS